MNYFSCAYFCFAARGECVFVHLSALALAHHAPAGSIWRPWMELRGGGASEWEGVTAVKHLSGSLPPLLFKCRHAFAHKDAHTRTRGNVPCDFLWWHQRSKHSRGRKPTPTHTNTRVPSGHLRSFSSPARSSPAVIIPADAAMFLPAVQSGDGKETCGMWYQYALKAVTTHKRCSPWQH